MRKYLQGFGFLLFVICSFGILYSCFAEDECGAFQMRCATTRKCLPLSWKCDGDSDCGLDDKSDEQDCPVKTCNDQEKQCSDGICIPEQWVCDGDNDCPGGEDERNCKMTSQIMKPHPIVQNTVKTCNDQEKQCSDGICIPEQWVCDGDNDCPGGEDERYCTAPTDEPCDKDKFFCVDECNGNQFKCQTIGMCISKHWVCDGLCEVSSTFDIRRYQRMSSHCGI